MKTAIMPFCALSFSQILQHSCAQMETFITRIIENESSYINSVVAVFAQEKDGRNAWKFELSRIVDSTIENHDFDVKAPMRDPDGGPNLSSLSLDGLFCCIDYIKSISLSHTIHNQGVSNHRLLQIIATGWCSLLLSSKEFWIQIVIRI